LFPHWYENVVSTLIWKCLDRLYRFFIYGVLTPLSTIFQLYHGDQFVCQTNMHLIMWIENAFKFCGKLIHFYKERIIYSYKVRNNASFIIVNPITVDSIIFVDINFRKLKKMASCGYSLSWFVEYYQIIFYRIIEKTGRWKIALLRTLYEYMYVLKCARIINLFPHWYENVVSTLIWKCLDRLYWFFFYLWCFNATFNVNWQPHVFHLHNKKKKKSVLCKSESVYHKI
jgi:hypothetical protein